MSKSKCHLLEVAIFEIGGPLVAPSGPIQAIEKSRVSQVACFLGLLGMGSTLSGFLQPSNLECDENGESPNGDVVPLAM